MLTDEQRTNAYKTAIQKNASAIEGKVYMWLIKFELKG